ncbi:MAG: hypothetical protein ACTHM6_00925 [Tepidisphaeraceae bacterium]
MIRRSRIPSLVLAAAVVVGGIGCESDPLANVNSTQPSMATDVDPATATNEYWLAMTPRYSISDSSFDRLWNAAETVSEDYLFQIDRRDKRSGVMTTLPNVSAQWFEFWRPELQTAEDKLISSASSHRRTIYWQIEHTGNTYTVTPRVIIERQVLAERRISGVLNKAYFRRPPNEGVYGTPETDVGITLPQAYWYPVGRDYALEQKLVEEVGKAIQ